MASRFAWMTSDDTLAVTTCADGVDARQESEELTRRGQIPQGAEIVFDPILPNAPPHQIIIRNGQIVVDPSRPEPVDRRKEMIQRAKAATTISQLQQLIVDILQ